MIYTLTMNPAIDMNIQTNAPIKAGQVNRTHHAVFTPNGKGLNVSFVLAHFGIPSKIMGFFGGFSGKYIVDTSQKRGFDLLPIWIEETTRMNIFLNDVGAEYKFVNEGAQVSRSHQDEMLTQIRKAKDMEYLSISGSLPPGIAPSYYDELLTLCKEKNVSVILDISSPKLRDLLAYHPLLIKPNDEELHAVFGYKADTHEEVFIALKKLHAEGAQNILLTLGARGAYFSDGNAVYFASAYPVQLLSSACAGDAALAAFLSVWLHNSKDIESALKNMAATGANVAESNALGSFEHVERYRKKIHVRRWG